MQEISVSTIKCDLCPNNYLFANVLYQNFVIVFVSPYDIEFTFIILMYHNSCTCEVEIMKY